MQDEMVVITFRKIEKKKEKERKKEKEKRKNNRMDSLTNELTSVTLKTKALSLSGESLSHTYVGDNFSIDPYVAFTYGFAFLPNMPTRPLKFSRISLTERTPPVCTPLADADAPPERYSRTKLASIYLMFLSHSL